jgi:predicted ATP-grasp superfamily ATP-dependent carboligase
MRPRVRGESGRPGALVVGGDYQGLGIVRSLGRQGVAVVVLDDEPSISRYSRYAWRALRVPDLRDHDRLVATVLEIGRRLDLQGWVLYATRDEVVAAFSRYRVELSSLFRVPTPPWDTIRWAWDKRLTYRLAGELGIATPRTWHAADAAALADLDVTFPVTLKPAIKEHFIYQTNIKALRADGPDDLRTAFRQACSVIPADEVILQEYIPGGGESQFSYCSFFRDGGSVGTLLARRTRQRPTEFGRSSTYVETIEMPALEEPSERLLRAIDYYGLVELEYKLDSRDGRLKLLDFNPRTWGYHSIGGRSGVDFPWMLFSDQLGFAVPPSRARSGVTWMRISTDLPTSLGEITRGHMAWRSYADSVRGIHTEAVFERDDPLPALAELALLPHLLRTRGAHRWKARAA